ncbi:hypothetical protein M405DRAFT_522772 [Rhizopogon salebrosus TDB-379]|nr:hypothetical protein M405DRAFT_522772 [Rhizopogon salebrosus TDB-379]
MLVRHPAQHWRLQRWLLLVLTPSSSCSGSARLVQYMLQSPRNSWCHPRLVFFFFHSRGSSIQLCRRLGASWARITVVRIPIVTDIADNEAHPLQSPYLVYR